jgi:two-component system cell cycle sensor histidine kinase/response regulator CckA
MKGCFRLFILMSIIYMSVPLCSVSAIDLKTIKVGIYENEPKIFSEKEKPSGFWVELLNYIALEEGWNIEWVHGTWDECLQRLENGEIDLMPDVAYTKERNEKYDFQNETVFISWTRIYVPMGSKIQSLPDLDNKKIAVLKGSVNYVGTDGIKELTEKFGINSIFVETNSYNNVFKLLEEKEVDAGVVNKNFGNSEEKEYKVKRTTIVFQPSDLRFAFPKKSSLTPLLISRIGYHIREMKADKSSVYYNLIERYFEGPITERFMVPLWIKKTMFAICGLLLFLVMVSIVSRFQVKKKTEQLKESEERYRRLFENSPEGILVAEVKNKRFLYANSSICRMLGYSKEEFKNMSVYDIHPKDSLDNVISNFEAQARGEKTLAPLIPCLRKDGTVIYADIVTTMMEIEGRECNVGFFTDITQRKKAEEEKEKINLQLLQAQKMESVGRLAGTIAHDFNNLLTAIIGYGNLLCDELSSEDPRREMLEEMLNAANQAARLTGQLLTFSRKTPVKLEVLDLNSVVKELKGMIDRLIGEDIVFFLSDTHGGQINIKGDVTQIEQVILNLVVNARDAMPEGGRLSLKTEKVTISEKETVEIPYSYAGDFACLTITDTGIGMSEDMCSKIFDPFYTTKKTGTGLGLSVVHGIIKKHKGWINVESEPDKCTTFRIYLPLCYEEKEEKHKDTVSLSALQGKGETILIIEDEEITRTFIFKVLSENGYSVLEASCVEEAKKIFEENKDKIKMVFSDVVLSDGSGLALAEKFISEDENIRILLSSGYMDKKAELARIAKKNFKFLEKPYEAIDLLKNVKVTLS